MSEAVQTLPATPALLAALCALWQKDSREVWIALQGGSMIPTVLPGCRLLLRCSCLDIAPQEIIAYRDGSRLVVHRVIQILPGLPGEERQFLCRGDGNRLLDPIVPEACVVGKIVRITPLSLQTRLVCALHHPRRHLRFLARKLRRFLSD